MVSYLDIDWYNKKVLVTGGAGFIGSHLSRRLLKEGAIVRVVDNLLSGRYERIEDMIGHSNFLFWESDIRQYDACLEAVRDCDYVFHLAANMGGIGFITRIAAEVMHDNTLMTSHMLEASQKTRVKRFFYASSACVYPEEHQMVLGAPALKESDAFPASPDSFYGWDKVYGELLCKAYTKDYKLVSRIARFHNVFGPGADWEEPRAKVIMTLLRKAIHLLPGEPMLIWGDGRQERSFLYIDDAIEGILAFMSSSFSEPLNIGSDFLINVDDLARLVLLIVGKKDIQLEHQLDKPQGVRSRNADLTLTKKTLGWIPKISLSEGIQRSHQWLKTKLG